MKSSLRSVMAILVLCVVPLAMTAQEGAKSEAQPAKDPLAQSARAIGGEWVDEKGVNDPNAPHGRFISEWGIGKKAIRGKTFWVNKGVAQPIYEGLTWAKPGNGAVEYVQVSAGGDVYNGTVEEKEDTSIARFTAHTAAGVMEYEQHGRYIDDDTLESTVYLKKDGKLVPAHKFKFHRKPLGWGLASDAAKPDAEPAAK